MPPHPAPADPAPAVAARRPARARAAVLLAGQLAAAAAVGAYLLAGGPAAPDGGLRQLDLLFLDEPVPALALTPGTATMVVAVGDPADPACVRQVRLAAERRGTPEGLDPAYGLVLLVPVDTVPPAALAVAPDLDLRADAGGALARALALTEAATACRPGYALVDPAGAVRYRTYDPGWAEHAGEQEILLADLS